MVGGPSPFDDDDDVSRSGEVLAGTDVSASKRLPTSPCVKQKNKIKLGLCTEI